MMAQPVLGKVWAEQSLEGRWGARPDPYSNREAGNYNLVSATLVHTTEIDMLLNWQGCCGDKLMYSTNDYEDSIAQTKDLGFFGFNYQIHFLSDWGF